MWLLIRSSHLGNADFAGINANCDAGGGRFNRAAVSAVYEKAYSSCLTASNHETHKEHEKIRVLRVFRG
jgi:hypothetical protein